MFIQTAGWRCLSSFDVFIFHISFHSPFLSYLDYLTNYCLPSIYLSTHSVHVFFPPFLAMFYLPHISLLLFLFFFPFFFLSYT